MVLLFENHCDLKGGEHLLNPLCIFIGGEEGKFVMLNTQSDRKVSAIKSALVAETVCRGE